MSHNFAKYENLIRRLLQDIPTRDNQGFFWDPAELRLALNMAQLTFVKYVLATKQFYYLNRLINKVNINSPVSEIDPSWDMLIPTTAWVLDQNGNLNYARIYMGDGVVFENVGHNACLIIGDTIRFVTRDRNVGGQLPTTGILYYYRYPREIYFPTDDTAPIPLQPDVSQDFDDTVYEHFIIPYGVAILGLKEITNQRDQKFYKRFLTQILSIPQSFANFVADFEFTGIKVRPGRPESQEIT